ncbi:MAG: EAL domain-containing protein, partial [Candidatus Methylumidiphilus sp.]
AFERLRRGFAKGQLCLFFQPKVDFARQAVLGAEALIRWQQPILGLLLPEEFIGIAEDNDMALSIGQWAIREALRQMRVWRREGIDLQVAVNVFARQLQSPDFVQNLRHILAEFPDIPPGRLKLEITESAALPDLNTDLLASSSNASRSAWTFRWTTSAPATPRCCTCAIWRRRS